MNITNTSLGGVVLISIPGSEDCRGTFNKFSNTQMLQESNLPHDFKETFVTTSHKHVLRGMHVQCHPHEAAKLVSVVSGRILDVVLNIGSHEYTHNEVGAGTSIFVPAGFAHGFLSLEDNTMLLYQQTACHAPDCDKGIRYDSFGFFWGVKKFTMSFRDLQFPTLTDYENTIDRWVG